MVTVTPGPSFAFLLPPRLTWPQCSILPGPPGLCLCSSLCLEVPFPMTYSWQTPIHPSTSLLGSPQPQAGTATALPQRCGPLPHAWPWISRSFASMDHEFHETWELASLSLPLWACMGQALRSIHLNRTD